MKETAYKKYLIAILLVIQAFNYMDGMVLGLVLQNIKADLHLSDTQLGFLSGIAFALFYSIMGIPIARWADRGNRVTIISLTAAMWSVMVPLCGLATTFVQLVLIRIGVAIGEAGCVPPAHSLIADNFTRAERPRAVAIYLLGGSFSTLIGYFLAGWLNELCGWRLTFVVLGLPGLIPAALARFTIKEPRRRVSTAMAGNTLITANPRKPETSSPRQPSLREVCVGLWRNVTFRHLVFCFSVMSFFASGILQWQPAFFIRSYGLKTGELGTWFAAIYGLGGIAGTYWGGELATRYAANNERLQLKTMTLIYCLFGFISSLTYLVHNLYLTFALIGLCVVGVTAAAGPLFATIQTLVPPRMRAMSIAIIYLFSNLIGLGLGPLAAGALSDAYRPWAAEESLRYALLSLSPGYLWGAWHLWRASRTVTRDIGGAQDDRAANADDGPLLESVGAMRA